eukprot:COSAG06_NODE_2503_length_6752_cov_51.525778_1_plen_75_part_10
MCVPVGAASDLLGSDSVRPLEVKETRLELSRLDMREAAADHTHNTKPHTRPHQTTHQTTYQTTQTRHQIRSDHTS